MDKNLVTSRNEGKAFLSLCLFFAIVVATLSSGESKAASSAKGPQAVDESQYVGTEVCRICHEGSFQKWKNTPMGKALLDHPKTPEEKRSCEACHGPGRTHVQSPEALASIEESADRAQYLDAIYGPGRPHVVGNRDDVKALVFFDEFKSKEFKEGMEAFSQDKNAQCLQCHEKGNRMFWRGSPHQSRGLACVDCHQVMTEKKESISREARFSSPLTDVQSTKASQPELCLRCHQMRRAQLQRSSHMPFREGKVTCTSCHNPHGTPNPKQLIQATLNENCYSCHTERRGPFLWEHPPVVENCGNCHEPHGSTNPQLLRVRAPKLCQECHNDGQHRSTAYANVMPSIGNGIPAGFNNRVLNRGCPNCHARIHGSNHPSGNYFTR